MNADPHKYYLSLDRDEQEYINGLASAIEGRIRAIGGNIDYMDRVMARRIAIELHIVSKASDYVENVSGLTQGSGEEEKKAALLDEIRKRDKDIFKMLKSLGVLDDPESQKVDAVREWRSFIEGRSP